MELCRLNDSDEIIESTLMGRIRKTTCCAEDEGGGIVVNTRYDCLSISGKEIISVCCERDIAEEVGDKHFLDYLAIERLKDIPVYA